MNGSGRIVVACNAMDGTNNQWRVALARLLPQGDIDTSFSTNACAGRGSFTNVHSGRRISCFSAVGNYNDVVSDLVPDVAGNLYVTGATDGLVDEGGVQSYVLKVSASDEPGGGNTGTALDGNSYFRSAHLDSDGRCLVAVGDNGPTRNFFFLSAFDIQGMGGRPGGSCSNVYELCFIGGAGLGDAGPDEAGDLNLDRKGRFLFAGTYRAVQGGPAAVLLSRIHPMFIDGLE